MSWFRRPYVFIRTDEDRMLTEVVIQGKAEVCVIEDQPVKRTWLKRRGTVFHGGPDVSRPIVVARPTVSPSDMMAGLMYMLDDNRKKIDQLKEKP